VTYRYPGVLAKIVTTLDVLSQGRSMFGIGAAWYEREHVGLGIPYPPVRERFEMLEETIQICRQMWTTARTKASTTGWPRRSVSPHRFGRDPADIRKTAGLFRDPFEDLDDYLETVQSYARLGIDLINVGPLPGNPDPVGFVGRLGDEVVPKVAAIA